MTSCKGGYNIILPQLKLNHPELMSSSTTRLVPSPVLWFEQIRGSSAGLNCIRVHLDHGRSLGWMRVHLYVGVHWDTAKRNMKLNNGCVGMEARYTANGYFEKVEGLKDRCVYMYTHTQHARAQTKLSQITLCLWTETKEQFLPDCTK